jgi:hypothetical protein
MTFQDDLTLREPAEEPGIEYPTFPAEHAGALVIGTNPDGELLGVGYKAESRHTVLLRYNRWNRWEECRTAHQTEIDKYDQCFLALIHVSMENSDDKRTEWKPAIIYRHVF